MSDDKSCKNCDDASCSAKQKQANETQEEFEDRQKLEEKLCRIKHKFIVLSGKGGVGKTTVAANLGLALASEGKKTGILDVDIHGPSIPHILGLAGQSVEVMDNQLVPVPIGKNLKVMSIGFMLKGSDDAVIWRGPLKMGVIRQFLRDVMWEDLDYLVVDCPPGTGDEPLSVIQLLDKLDGAVVVTTPQQLSIDDVRRSIQFCRTTNVPVLGVVENMSGFVCPHCGETTDIFKTGGGQQMAKEMDVPFLGKIPLDPAIAEASDSGIPYIKAFAESETAKAFSAALQPLKKEIEEN